MNFEIQIQSQFSNFKIYIQIQFQIWVTKRNFIEILSATILSTEISKFLNIYVYGVTFR